MPSFIDQLLEESGMPVLEDLAGISVSLRRRGATNVTVADAIFQAVSYQLENEQGFVQSISGREWIVAVADYTLGGTAGEPQEGDLIVDADGTWQALPVGDLRHAEKAAGGYRWLIRTKKVG